MSQAFVQALLMDDPDIGLIPPTVIGPGDPAPVVNACIPDLYWPNVILMLHAEDFYDSSSYAQSMTKVGSISTSSTQYKFGSASLYSSTQTETYLQSPPLDQWQLNSDFCIECWIYGSDPSPDAQRIFQKQGTSDVSLWFFSGTLNVIYKANPRISITGFMASRTNRWVHLAVVRSGTTLTLYVDGVASGSYTGTIVADSTQRIICVGGSQILDQSWIGYIDEFKVTSGYPRYTSDFTPATQVSCNSTTNIDTCIVDGYYGLTAAETELNTNSYTGTIAFSNGNRTAAYTTGTGQGGIASYGSHASGKYYFEILRNSGTSYGGSVHDDVGGTPAPLSFYGYDTVFGFAYRRSGAIYVNGVSVASVSSLSAGDIVGFAVDLDAHKLWVSVNGTWISGDPSAGTSPMSSSLPAIYYYIGGTFESGSAVTVTIAARDADLTYAKPSGFSSWTSAPILTGAMVSLLVHCDRAFKDTSASEKEIQVYNSTTISSSVKKFGSGSIQFSDDGASVGVGILPVTTLGLDYTKFTVEGWIYPLTIAGSTRCITSVVEHNATEDAAVMASMYVAVLTDGTLVAFQRTVTSGGTTQIASSAGAVSLNTWQHVCLAVDTANAYLFLNGTLVASTGSWTTYPTAKAQYAALGRLTSEFVNSTQYKFRGYMDEIRITKGIARYTATFTAPAYPSCEFSTLTIGSSGPGHETLTGQAATAYGGYLNNSAGMTRLTGQAVTAAKGSVSVFAPSRTVALVGQALSTYNVARMTPARYPYLRNGTVTTALTYLGTPLAFTLHFNSDGSVTQQVNGGPLTPFFVDTWAYPADGRSNALTTMIPVTAVPQAFKQTLTTSISNPSYSVSLAANSTMAAGCTFTFTARASGIFYYTYVVIVPTTLNPSYGESGYTSTFYLTFTT